jgi:VCBS repeat-containing protein
LTQDTARVEAMSCDTSKCGARIWITADGKVGYDAAASSTFKAQLQALAVGETLTDSFTYAIRLGNGTLSWATATIQFTGENDGPTILGASTSGVPQLGAVVEDATLSATGTISFSESI